MKRKHYDIHKDFKKLSKTNPPINKYFAKIIQFFSKPIFYRQKSKQCLVKRNYFIINGKKIKFLEYSPKGSDQNLPCLIYYHGGGFILPAAPYHYKNAERYAVACGCKVLVPDYPLAPKNKYPVPINVCFEFYKKVLSSADDLNIDENKIIVGGDSAGASLALGVCMMASDFNVKVPLAEMLLYPVVGITEPTESMKQFDDTGMCNNKDFAKYCRLYFENDEDKHSRYASAYNQNLYKYPTTYIETTEFDCLRDDGIIFAEKLKESGVNVYTNHTKNTLHAYDMAKNSLIVEQSLSIRNNFLKEQFNKK